MSHVPAKPGRPGSHNGKRLRWRSVVRATRSSNRAAVERLAEAEIAMKEKVTRAFVRARLVQAVLVALLVGAAGAGVIIARCAL